MKMHLTRDVGMEECGWLDRDFKAGETVFCYDKYTYGCVSWPNGIACTLDEDIEPFFELPRSALEECDD